MEPNFRGDGGYKFGIYGRNKNEPFAIGFSGAGGNASIEAVNNPEPFSIV